MTTCFCSCICIIVNSYSVFNCISKVRVVLLTSLAGMISGIFTVTAAVLLPTVTLIGYICVSDYFSNNSKCFSFSRSQVNFPGNCIGFIIIVTSRTVYSKPLPRVSTIITSVAFPLPSFLTVTV